MESKKWLKWAYLQNRNRLIDFENKLIVIKEKTWQGCKLEFGINIYTLLYIRASLIAQLVKNPSAMKETPIWFLGQEDPLENSCGFLGFPCGSAGKESTCNVGDLGSIPGLGRSPGKEKGYPLQYSGLENSSQRVRHNWVTFTFTYYI